MLMQEKSPNILEIWFLVPLGFHQRYESEDIAINSLTYRYHIHNAWPNCCLIGYKLLDISRHSNVASRKYSSFRSSLG